jgi:hypothetical protein
VASSQDGEVDVADLTNPLNEGALDALTLGSEEARAAYDNQRQKLEVERMIRNERKQAPRKRDI